MAEIKVELQDTMSGDLGVAQSAWTSSLTYAGKELKTEADVKRIINMLADHKHSTPFESVVFRFWIRMPIQTDRQHMTHRIASHNGMSGRYRTMPDDYLEIADDVFNVMEKSLGSVQALFYEQEYKKLCETSNQRYRELLVDLKASEKKGDITNEEYKRVREVYRGVLPQNNMTERVTTMNLRSFANYIKLRNSPHAQPEIRKVAELMLQAVKDSGVCPVALEALERNDWII